MNYIDTKTHGATIKIKNISIDIRKILKQSKFMIFLAVGAELFDAE